MVLVTGASGFLGRHLVRYLSPLGRVRALYNRHPPDAELGALPGVTWIRCDLLDIFEVEEAMTGITEVYHCAAMVTYDPKRRDEILHFNPESTANIVNQALQQGLRKMVHVSSIAALGRTAEKGKEITEEAEWGESKYNSAYGLSKYLAEMEVWRAIGEGLNAVIVNPGIILGPGNHRDLSMQLMKIVHRGFPFYPTGITSWVGVDDVVKLLAMLMESDVTAERYIISEGNFTYRDIFILIANALQKSPPRFRANSFLSGIVWRLSKVKSTLLGKSALITRESTNNANSFSFYNNDKLLTEFPAFSYRPVKETIDQMARSFIMEHSNISPAIQAK